MLMQVKAVTIKFSEVMKTYQVTLAFIQDEIKDRVKRQIHHIDRNLTEEQLDIIGSSEDVRSRE